MKKKIIKIFSLVLILVFLSSCDATKVKKTKEITNKISVTPVIIELDAINNEDYSEFFNLFNRDFILPGLFEGVIPQGFCFDYETGYFLITGYYEDAAYPSVVMSIDGKTGEFVGAHPLKTVNGEDYFGHVGGIGTSENTVYIGSENECLTFPTALLKSTENGKSIQFHGTFKTLTRASFLTVYNEILYIGDFIESSKKDRESVKDILTLDSGETLYGFCEAYELVNGLPSEKKVNSDSTGYIPDYFIAVPEQVQGMAFTKTDKIVFSTSYGRTKNSKIYIYEDVLISDRAGTRTVDGNEIDVYACDSKSLIKEIVAPPMAEALAIHPDGIYIHFESGAAKYRNGGGKYPLDTAYITNIE